MTRFVGNQHRSEFILDPLEALRRGEQLDQIGPRLLNSKSQG